MGRDKARNRPERELGSAAADAQEISERAVGQTPAGPALPPRPGARV